jgi:hypothetical protein
MILDMKNNGHDINDKELNDLNQLYQLEDLHKYSYLQYKLQFHIIKQVVKERMIHQVELKQKLELDDLQQ